ncbi:MAG: portal protein [Planctomycetota bacterium]|jgi:hypothetical protein
MAIKQVSDAKEFLDGWIGAGQRVIDSKVHIWREVMGNVLVEPYADESVNTSNPYRNAGQRDIRTLILKDPESSAVAETFRNQLMAALFSDAEGKYVLAEPTGLEDVKKADTVSRLLRYDFALPGVYRTMSESMLDLAMFGTVILETPWKLEEKDVIVRSVEQDMGMVFDQQKRDIVVTYDDPEIRQVDLTDWYPDLEEPRIENMRGAAKGFKLTPSAARAMADGGDALYDKAAVDAAIKQARKKHARRKESQKREVRYLDKDASQKAPAFNENFDVMEGYEYWGEVPWDCADGVQRRVITMLNGEIVRNDPWPLLDDRLPFHCLVINPVKGRHYGKAPAETIRYAQDFADAMLMLIAEAAVRQVHPPVAIDISKDIDPAAVRAWDLDNVIAVDGPTTGAVDTMQYNANMFQGASFQSQLKDQMRQASGALGAVQGQGLGVNRASATEAAGTFEKAQVPIEAVAQLLEKDGLPQVARGLLRRNQQFLEDNEDLKRRIGELPESVWLGDIMGEFDIQFVGTRNAVSRQAKLQAYDRLVQMATSLPMVANMIPWPKVLRDLFLNVLQLPEGAAIFQDQMQMQQLQQMMINLQQQQMAAQAGGMVGPGNNGVAEQPESPGLPPGQAIGEELE